MIQDIEPKQYHVAYVPNLKPTMEAGAMVCSKAGILVKVEEGDKIRLPFFSDLVEDGLSFEALSEASRHLFAIDEQQYFLLPETVMTEELLASSYKFMPNMAFRDFEPNYEGFAAITASQFYRFYKNRAYCGRCGTKNEHSKIERAMVCPKCGFTDYPKISPAIIVAIKNGNKLLLTHYARFKNDPTRKALVAGFVEVGETPEVCVQREVFEEVGIHVKNIKPYLIQPWSFSDSLMLAYTAELDGSNEITIDGEELCDAGWYGRDEIVLQNTHASVGHELMEAFVEGRI